MVRKNLTKQNIADKINFKLGYSKEEAKSFVNCFFSIIQEKVIAGEEVKIPKLGNFSLKKKAMREEYKFKKNYYLRKKIIKKSLN